MKLSQETLAVFRNFSKISGGLFISPGNVLKTKTKAVYAEAIVAENFPLEFAIWDVHDFLSKVALFREPIFDFTHEAVQITESDGTAEIRYAYAGGNLVQPCPTPKPTEMPSDHFTFVITEEQWGTLRKALGIAVVRKRSEAEVQFMNLTSDGKTVRIGTQKYRQPSGSEYSLCVSADPHGHECNMVFDTDNLPLMTGSYEITVTPHYTQFKHTSGYSLRYLVAAEPTLSNWGGKRTYQVRVTKGMAQDCFVPVLAHSPEEAETIVRMKPDEEFKWRAETGSTRECKVVG